MRIATRVVALTLFFGSPACFASETGMWWWNQNGDSVVLDGVTISLSGSGIQRASGAVVQDPPGPEDATFTFTFDPPVGSFQMFVQSVAPLESIQFQSPLPTFVDGWGLGLVAEGTPIQSVHGFFLNDENKGFVIWTGPGIASVTFTMAHGDGSIQITQMGVGPEPPSPLPPPHLRNAIEIDATPATNGVVLHLAISDGGGDPEVRGFVIQRRAIFPCVPGDWQTVHCITSRQPGKLSQLTIPDTDDVHANTQYVYRVLGSSWPPCVPSVTQDEFLRAFDPTGWGFEILSFVSTGIEPVPIAHGRLIAVPEEGPSGVRVEQCSDSCNPYAYGWISADGVQYVGTDSEVLLYGATSWAGNAEGWRSTFTSVEPKSCTLAVKSTTWSQFKQLYRDPTAGER